MRPPPPTLRVGHGARYLFIEFIHVFLACLIRHCVIERQMEPTLEVVFINSFNSKFLILLSSLLIILWLSEGEIKSSFLFALLQEKNPTNVPGKGARGSLLGLMSSQDISESTLASNLFSVQTVTAVSRVLTTLPCTGSATCWFEGLRLPPWRPPHLPSSLPSHHLTRFVHVHFNLDSAGLNL